MVLFTKPQSLRLVPPKLAERRGKPWRRGMWQIMKTLEALTIRRRLTPDQEVNVAVAAINYSYAKEPLDKNCQTCAACCYTFSIPSLKQAGEPCPNLSRSENGRFECIVYENRPEACREFSCDNMPINTPLQKERISALFAGRELVREIPLIDFRTKNISASQETLFLLKY